MANSLQRHNKNQGNKHLNRRIFRRLQKTGRVNGDMACYGRVLQVWTVAIAKARLLMIDSHVWQTGKICL